MRVSAVARESKQAPNPGAKEKRGSEGDLKGEEDAGAEDKATCFRKE